MLNREILLIGRFPFDFYPVNDNNLCIIINHVKDTIITGTYTIAFFFHEFFRAGLSWIGGEGKDCFIYSVAVLLRNLLCFFFSFLFDYYLVVQAFSQVFRNSSYGVKEIASFSAFKRSMVSSKSSIESIRYLYSLNPMTTAFLLPFSSIRYLGFVFFKACCICYPQFCLYNSNIRMLYNQQNRTTGAARVLYFSVIARSETTWRSKHDKFLNDRG